MEQTILKELIKSKKILKKKFQSVKFGEAEKTTQIEKTFKPLSEPLKKLVNISYGNIVRPIIKKSQSVTFKNETPKKMKKEEEEEEDEEQFESAKEEEEEDDYESDEIHHKLFSEILEDHDLNQFKNNKKFDEKYGPYKDKNGDWRFGNASFELRDGKIYVGNQKWSASPGLMELLLLKNPQHYEAYELAIYKKILLNTNAHKKKYEEKNPINSSRKYKYTKIIKSLFQSTHTGDGLLKINCKKSKYIYYQNPNMLVKRLELLVMAKQSGHSNVQIEINSILEELRKLDIIY